ncbi:uncharacterized protein [Physcomitrium patens]|uniref:MalT-like TPR region domain-containing protein n=1 Tax=Physcomitrium patens TaxID=3218 RepID=A0A2K1KJY8_PHYPA|nr:kinesin light chain 4-like [Physcomitrium patens]PNR54085.1 hypothetical protein PHYPA_007761 [Physcomitrium patens]|eukprot:XP_024374834.1 kinesin light chain 4-like [Physcomitrella patens]
MAKSLALSVFKARGVSAQHLCHIVVESGVKNQDSRSFRCPAYAKTSLPKIVLKVSCARKCREVIKGQPFSSFYGVLPESFCCDSNRHGRKHLDVSLSRAIKAEGKFGNEGFRKLEVIEDNHENVESALEDQFRSFEKAMESQDDQLAERIMEEMGYSVDIKQMKGLVNEVNAMQMQLQDLHDQVVQLVEEADEDTAIGLIEANLEVVMEQLESGYRGMEQVTMLDTLAQLRMSLGQFEEAEYLLEMIKELLEVVGIDSLQPLADRVLEHMGTMYAALDKPAEGQLYYVKSLEIQEDLVGKDSPLLVTTLLGLASTYTDMDELGGAIEVYNRVVTIIEKTKGSNDETLALPLSKLGHCLLEEDRIDEAESVLHRALELVEQKYGPKDGRVGVAKCALARVQASAGAVDESIFLYQEGLQLMENCDSMREGDPSMETARTDLAELLNLVGRNDEAEKLWEENLRVKERLFGPNHPSVIVHLQNLATSYATAGKHEKCEPLLRRSLKLTVEEMGPNAPQVSVPLECLATALHHLGRQVEAEPIARRALEIREAAFGPDSAIVGEGCNCLASILHANGKYHEALTLMRRVLAIQEKELGSDSPALVLTLELLIMLLDKCGREEEIEPLYLRLAKLSASEQVTGEGEGEDYIDDDFDIRNLGDLGKLFGSRAAPASNMLDVGDDKDIIDI